VATDSGSARLNSFGPTNKNYNANRARVMSILFSSDTASFANAENVYALSFWLEFCGGGNFPCFFYSSSFIQVDDISAS
jgi:hypothetical protein